MTADKEMERMWKEEVFVWQLPGGKEGDYRNQLSKINDPFEIRAQGTPNMSESLAYSWNNIKVKLSNLHLHVFYGVFCSSFM